jgi:hypothetical protein
MLSKLCLAAIPLLFLGSVAVAEDIVTDNDWRAGETGFIHNNNCGWHHHRHWRTASGVTYSDSNFGSGVTYDTEYAPASEYTTYDTEYTPGYYGQDTRFGVRYDGNREWREGQRDYDRDREFRDERFHDRDAGVGARVNVGGHNGVGVGGGVDSHEGAGGGVNVGGHGVGAHVGGDNILDVHAK